MNELIQRWFVNMNASWIELDNYWVFQHMRLISKFDSEKIQTESIFWRLCLKRWQYYVRPVYHVSLLPPPISVHFIVVYGSALARKEVPEQRGATRSPVPAFSRDVSIGFISCTCYRHHADGYCMARVVPEYEWQPSGLVRCDPPGNRACLRCNRTPPPPMGFYDRLAHFP